MTKKFKYTVEFTIDKLWIEDGFDLTDAQAQDMIETRLPFARSDEVRAKVVKRPLKSAIKKAQGY